jgi:hypothetical protein
MLFKKNWFYLYFIITVSFCASYSLLNAYTSGDQAYYHLFYESIQGVSLNLIHLNSISILGSSEPLSIFILWVGSNLGFEKNTWISLLNAFLVTGLFLLLKKYKASNVVILLILTNFYLIVLMTGAERLKIAYIFIIWSFVFESKWRLALAVVSPLAHFQLLIFLVSLYFAKEFSRIRFPTRIKVKNLRFHFIVLLLLASFLLSYNESLFFKIYQYLDRQSGFDDIFNILLLTCLMLFVIKNKIKLLASMFPFVCASAIIGGERINIMAVSVVIGLLLFENRLSHPLSILLLIYFSLKSISFIFNIYIHGDGFA